ncbi:hypothetical protein [Streptomyces sp. BRA346]|uniref:hypothetical protein n=1 Tax=Streptomyces sp. BRA346 TaxID=2878199 RepID=UPI004063BFAB
MTHRIARGPRHAANAFLLFIRENTRDALGINYSADVFDVGFLFAPVAWFGGR